MTKKQRREHKLGNVLRLMNLANFRGKRRKFSPNFTKTQTMLGLKPRFDRWAERVARAKRLAPA